MDIDTDSFFYATLLILMNSMFGSFQSFIRIFAALIPTFAKDLTFFPINFSKEKVNLHFRQYFKRTLNTMYDEPIITDKKHFLEPFTRLPEMNVVHSGLYLIQN